MLFHNTKALRLTDYFSRRRLAKCLDYIETQSFRILDCTWDRVQPNFTNMFSGVSSNPQSFELLVPQSNGIVEVLRKCFHFFSSGPRVKEFENSWDAPKPVHPHGKSQQVSAVVNPCSPREMSFLTAPLILLRFGLLILARCIPWIYSDATEGFWLASVIEIPTCALLNIPGRAADTFAAVVLRLPRHTTHSPFLRNRV